MVEKLEEYSGWAGRWHTYKENVKTWWGDSSQRSFCKDLKTCMTGGATPKAPPERIDDVDEHRKAAYSHIYRRKTRSELIRISAAVMGIEFSYAGETAFVSPTLLKIGVKHQHMTLVWALSPLVGFFLTPILGSLSDRCRLNFGRRRPFILMLSLGVFLGLLLVPNGEDLGYMMGDIHDKNSSSLDIVAHRTSANIMESNTTTPAPSIVDYVTPHPWGIFFTILGTVLLDFDADACQSPARAYLLDVCVPEDHAKGLSTFTIMAGLGGFFGYALGGINWDVTAIGILFGGHVRAVFSLITIIFVVCVAVTISSFSEIPLPILEDDIQINEIVARSKEDSENTGMTSNADAEKSYGTLSENSEPARKNTNPFREAEIQETQFSGTSEATVDVQNIESNPEKVHETITLKHYLKSIVIMPFSLRIVCLTNLFCWMAHVCYSLYFTDFVGEAVFLGNPVAPEGSKSRALYEEGVRFGCWGMSMYSLSCSCYSLVIERLIKKYGAKKTYVGGLLTYSVGMMLMALMKNKIGVIFFSWTAGVMYSTLFTMPYLLVAHYHAQGTFEVTADGERKMGSQLRGLGTDVAIVSSMVFLAQFILSLFMGNVVTWTGTTTSVVTVASCLAFFGAISALNVMYLDL